MAQVEETRPRPAVESLAADESVSPNARDLTWVVSSLWSPFAPFFWPSSREFALRKRMIPENRGRGRPRSTWMKDSTLWTFIAKQDVLPPTMYGQKPTGYKRSEDPIPVHNMWTEHMWLFIMAITPLVAHTAYNTVLPNYPVHPLIASGIYSFYFLIYAVMSVKHQHYHMSIYGTFDEENRSRDLLSDADMKGLVASILIYMIIRGGITTYTLRDMARSPLAGLSVITPLKMMVWSVVLDYFFYVYHRACHEVPWLWDIHKKHHSTRHPTFTLAILAGPLQEFIELVGCPLLATLVIPLTASEQWLTMIALFHIETVGHTGIRAYWPVSAGFLLKYVGMELVIEDHDIHHRGGRAGRNYGKNTRVWDVLFNTCEDRIEKQPRERPFKIEEMIYGDRVFKRSVPMTASE